MVSKSSTLRVGFINLLPEGGCLKDCEMSVPGHNEELGGRSVVMERTDGVDKNSVFDY